MYMYMYSKYVCTQRQLRQRFKLIIIKKKSRVQLYNITRDSTEGKLSSLYATIDICEQVVCVSVCECVCAKTSYNFR